MNSRQRKSEQLGMDVSTAMHKLRIKTLLHILKKYNENICFVCGKKITKPEDLSIEHKKPWLYHAKNNNRRFWHMSNIAFSHCKCNRPHRYGSNQFRKIGPKNTAWCVKCQKFLNIKHFHKSKDRWNGYQNKCKSCRKKYRNGDMV